MYSCRSGIWTAPRKGASAGAVLHAPWRASCERRWFGAPSFWVPAMSTLTCPICKLTFDGAVVRKDGNVNCPSCGLLFKAPLPEPLWYYARAKQKLGPVSLAELQKLANSGLLQADDMVFQVGASTWQPARELSGLGFPSPASVGVSNLTANGTVSSIPVANLCPPSVEQSSHENRAWLKQVSATVRSATAYIQGHSQSTKIMLGAVGLTGLVATCILGGLCCFPGFLQPWSKSNSGDSAKVGGAIDPGNTNAKNGQSAITPNEKGQATRRYWNQMCDRDEQSFDEDVKFFMQQFVVGNHAPSAAIMRKRLGRLTTVDSQGVDEDAIACWQKRISKLRADIALLDAADQAIRTNNGELLRQIREQISNSPAPPDAIHREQERVRLLLGKRYGLDFIPTY